MEANFLRFLLPELQGHIGGRRVEKIFAPAFGLWTFKLGASAFLLLLASRKNNCMFFSGEKPENPVQPSSNVQWWRKRLKGRRILDSCADWPQRRAAWRLSPGQGQWLVLDLVQGPALQDELDSGFDQEPVWPSLEEIQSQENIYLQYPHISPPLRLSLQEMKHSEAWALLSDLAQGRAQGFYYYYQHDGKPYAVLPWKLPPGQAQGTQCIAYQQAAPAAEAYGWAMLQSVCGQAVAQGQENRRKKRLRKTLKRLEQEEARLHELAAAEEKAYLLKSNLPGLDKHGKMPQVEVIDYNQNRQIVDLDPANTVLQNMQLMFKKSAKAKRGLRDIERRRQEVQAEINELQGGFAQQQGQAWKTEESDTESTVPCKGSSRSLPARARGLQVHVFRSSQGFFILRGKNQKANHKLLSQAAKPFDLWFHVQDGAGAHVVLLKDSALQEVPRETVQEAAVLAGLASSHAESDKAEVCCALVKSVRKPKGAALGQVQVQKIEQTLSVKLDKELQDRLRVA